MLGLDATHRKSKRIDNWSVVSTRRPEHVVNLSTDTSTVTSLAPAGTCVCDVISVTSHTRDVTLIQAEQPGIWARQTRPSHSVTLSWTAEWRRHSTHRGEEAESTAPHKYNSDDDKQPLIHALCTQQTSHRASSVKTISDAALVSDVDTTWSCDTRLRRVGLQAGKQSAKSQNRGPRKSESNSP